MSPKVKICGEISQYFHCTLTSITCILYCEWTNLQPYNTQTLAEVYLCFWVPWTYPLQLNHHVSVNVKPSLTTLNTLTNLNLTFELSSASSYVWQALPCYTTLARQWFKHPSAVPDKIKIFIYFGGFAFPWGVRRRIAIRASVTPEFASTLTVCLKQSRVSFALQLNLNVIKFDIGEADVTFSTRLNPLIQ